MHLCFSILGDFFKFQNKWTKIFWDYAFIFAIFGSFVMKRGENVRVKKPLLFAIFPPFASVISHSEVDEWTGDEC